MVLKQTSFTLEEPDFEELFSLDPYLKIYESQIRYRYNQFRKLLIDIEKAEGYFSTTLKMIIICLFSFL